VLGRFALVPFAVGSASAAEVAGLLDLLWGGPETLVVISTDLSHYLPYREARALDQQTARQVLALDADGLGAEQACGRTPLSGLLYEGRRRGLEVVPLDLRNSGGVAGVAQVERHHLEAAARWWATAPSRSSSRARGPGPGPARRGAGRR
jgi:AmmeMemoRadiSam system protein B